MEGFGLVLGFFLLACLVCEVWRNVTTPNLRCRWLGHSIRMQAGWAYCERCKWREQLPPLMEG